MRRRLRPSEAPAPARPWAMASAIMLFRSAIPPLGESACACACAALGGDGERLAARRAAAGL